MLIRIDVNRLNKERYGYLKSLFNFPDYFGNNLDALYDCMTDMVKFAVVYDNYLSADDISKKIIRTINMAIHDMYMNEE